MDKIPHEPYRGVPPEDAYRYEARPYIAMSWEKVRALVGAQLAVLSQRADGGVFSCVCVRMRDGP